MVMHKNVPYIRCRDGIYYFVRRVPDDVKSYYSSDRISMSLRTKSNGVAIRATKSICQRLDDYWLGLRLQNMDIPAIHLVSSNEELNDDSPTITDALDLYLRLKGQGKDKTFIRTANRNIEYIVKVLGHKNIKLYTSNESSKFRDWLMEQGMSLSTVKRVFSSVKAIINLTIQEHGLNINNPFSKTYMPELDDKQYRESIPSQTIKHIQSLCREYDDDLRWLIALLSDTGMRLGEGVGLLKSDINIYCKIPHIKLIPHPWRRLKTKSSQRVIPLVNESLWACKRILEHTDNSLFAFPRYSSINGCNANSASAALNKWLKEQLTDNYVVHGFRHSFRDRLRAVECPSEIIDQLGGWSLKNVGQGYGKGYEPILLLKWISKIN
jgi:integrase